MRTPNPLKTPDFEFKSLLAVVLLASVLFALIVWPFFGALCWAVFIAIVFWPLHQRLLRGSGGRPNTAAAASLLVILLVVILPLAMLVASITQEASVFVEKMRAGEISPAQYFQQAFDALPEWVRSLLQRFGVSNLALVQQKIVEKVGASGQAITAQVLGIGQVTLDFVVAFFLMLYVLYFLFRDGAGLVRAIARTIPLRPEHTERLMRQFATVVRATVKGNILVALVQGALGSAAFWVLGLPGAILWGSVMAVLSLLPAVGAVLVWAPVAAYYFFTGELVKGVGLTLWGSVVIGLVDNLLRPILVGKETRLPDYLVLVATLGGIVVFGLNGFVIGPVIAAVFLVSWELLAAARQQAVVASTGAATPEATAMAPLAAPTVSPTPAAPPAPPAAPAADALPPA